LDNTQMKFWANGLVLTQTRSTNSAKTRLRLPEMKPWTLHDCRRSAATHMAELGVLPHVVEAILNHVSGHKSGVAGLYNRARYQNDMRAALQTWADYVDRFSGVGSDHA
jgi:integrase